MGAPGGLHIADRTHMLRSYPRCFVGREAVDWLVATRGVSRSEALRLGRSLVAVGLIQHVLEEHDFKDGDFFYRLADNTVGAASDALPEAAAGRKALQLALDFPWRSHSRGLLRHHQCATGRTIVDWIVQRHAIPRATAVHWAIHWMRQGALRHVFDTQAFQDDDRFLYRLG
jgi:Domain found in Dishevelled, Egl-10, and Pleckstrin (DEP)